MRRAINPVLGALGGALALALAVGTAGAQDTSRTGQTETPTMPGQGGFVDTAGYSGAERPDTGRMTYTRDTSRAGQDTSTARTGAGAGAGAAQDTAAGGAGATQDTSRARTGADTSAMGARAGARSDTSTTQTQTKTKAKGKKGKRARAGAADTAGGRTIRRDSVRLPHDTLRIQQDSPHVEGARRDSL